jgi:hypothetical protein
MGHLAVVRVLNRLSKKSFAAKMLIAVLATSYCMNAQSQVTFRKAIGNSEDDIATCVRETDDNGFIVTGTTGSVPNTNSNIYLFKLDSMGDLSWSKSFGSSYGTENSKKVLQTADGGFIVVGFTNSSGNGGYDIYTVRTDSVGDELWSATYGGPDWDFGNDIIALPNGNYGIVGSTYSYGNGNSDGYYIEIDDAGNEIRSMTYGGEDEDVLNALTLSADGNLLFCGSTKNDGAEDLDAIVVKTDLSGNLIWMNTYGEDGEDYFSDIIATTDLKYLAVGSTTSFGLDNKNFYLVKFTVDGSLEYEKNDGGSGDEEAREVTENLAGICSVVGYTTSYGSGDQSIILHQFGPGGWWINSPVYGLAFEDGYSIDYTHDNGYIIAGITNGYDVSNFDVLIIKTDADGQTGTTGDVDNVTDNLVGLEEMELEDSGFYVGMAETFLTVKSTEKSITSVTMVNLMGQAVLKKTFLGRNNIVDLDVASVPNGIYIVAVELHNGHSRVSKIFVSH